MSNSTHPAGRIMWRGLLLLLALGGVLWSLAAFPSFLRAGQARDISSRIIRDERFKPGLLELVLARIDAPSSILALQPEVSLADVLIRLRLAEDLAQRKTSEEADRAIEAAANRLLVALTESPSDAFLWLMLYSVDTSRGGFDPKNLAYLNQSYSAAPREGWIVLRRNRLALAIFTMLGETVRNEVVSEFASMVDSGFLEDATANLISVGWPYRKLLLASLTSADVANRQALSKLLAANGVRTEIPGIQQSDRPW